MSQANVALLQQRINQLTAEIASWQAGTAPMLPNAEGAGNVDWEGYVEKRYAEIEKLRAQITIEDGAWEFSTRGIG